jgi:hypothetical protein
MKLVTSEATIRQRKAAVEKANLTKAWNSTLRRSSTGRLLLLLERCVSLNNKAKDMDKLRRSRFLSELRYARKLADEAGIQNGWEQDKQGSFFLVFGLIGGDVVFSMFDQNLGTEPFPRKTNPSDNANAKVLERSIEQALEEIRRSA